MVRTIWMAAVAMSAVLAMLAADLAGATVATPMVFSVFRPCGESTEACAPQVLAQGSVERDSATRLERFLQEAPSRGDALPQNPVIAFDSPGGSVAGSMAMGRTIRRLQLSTRVDSTYARADGTGIVGTSASPFVRDAVCASACTLAFMGGVRRTVADGARFGVHQFASRAGNIGDSATQTTLVVLSRYVEDMGLDRRIVDIASVVPPNKMYWLSAAQMRTLKVDSAGGALVRWEIGARADGLPFLRVRQPLSPGREATLVLTVVDGRLVVAAGLAIRRSVQPDARVAGFPVGEMPQLILELDGERLRAEPLRAWSQGTETADVVSYRATSALDLQALERLGRARTLAIADKSTAAAAPEFSFDTPLSVDNLAAGAGLLVRAK